MASFDVFVTGGTGYIGRALLPLLARRGHRVRALTRGGRVPEGCTALPGNALDTASLCTALESAFGTGGPHAILHLVGVAHPAPWKAAQFAEVDERSVSALLEALVGTGLRPHLVYLSVAQPAPAMRAYVAVRARCEAALRVHGGPATFVRPWYVLGPGHRWAHALRPLYALAELLPATREGARRLGLVTLDQMVAALSWAIEHPVEPPDDVRILDVPAIRRLAERESRIR